MQAILKLDVSGQPRGWLTLNEARQLDLPAVTRWAIDLVERRIQLSPAEQLKQTAPFVRFAKGQEISIDL